MTTVYLIRHSKTLKVNNNLNMDSFQIQNEKNSLCIEGEKIAQKKFNSKEFDNIDVIYTSNYVRTIQTAKYIAQKNHIDINIMSDLGERKFGINSWEELPEDFERKQFLDEEYKIDSGENQKEVRERMYLALMNILKNNKDKRIAIVSHGTAISYLLRKWCDIKIEDNKMKYSYKGNTLLHNYFDYCETFKLEFDDNKLRNIENIKS